MVSGEDGVTERNRGNGGLGAAEAQIGWARLASRLLIQ